MAIMGSASYSASTQSMSFDLSMSYPQNSLFAAGTPLAGVDRFSCK